jgi:FtsP/CotA-like multicopper oxidase with cupredoxin domain
MKSFTKASALFVTLWPLVSFATSCPVNNVISDPQPFPWTQVGAGESAHWTGTLEIGEATLTVGGETITTRVYRVPGQPGTIPGPTLHMTPGQKYVLKFRNVLPYEAPVAAHNVFKDPNVSNLHTHGLHISGESPGDDVTRSFEGTAGGDFVYDILPDHMGGTFWYHAHHHGSTYLQVSGGAFGMIVIDDGEDGIPASVAAMEERQLVIAYLDPDVAGTGGDTLITGTLSPTWTVNGNVNGAVCMPPDTWQHWRVLLADRNAKLKTVSVGSQCEVALLARDGVWRTVAPLELASNSLSLTGASRADLAVRCSGDSTISVNTGAVANIFVDGTADPSPEPYAGDGITTWSAYRPAYLRDLRGLPVDNTETVNMGARTINGSKFDHDVPNFSLPANGLQQWSLKGAQNHPFHLHIYHVQINGSCGGYEDGEYYDVVASNCNIRFDLNAQTSSVYDGRTIMHCHILEHEDQGAMGWTDVLGGLPPPIFPAGFGYQDYYQPIIPGGNSPAAPDFLTATAVSSSQIDLVWSDNSSNEDTFDIEYSSNGTDFGFLAYVGSNITTYSVTGLAAGTTWHYRVRASNTSGSSGYSNSASATTQSAGEPASVQPGSITVTTFGVGKGLKKGRAIVVVRDDLGGLVENATVNGEFRGATNEQDLNGLTGPDGSTTFETSTSFKGKVSLSFCVTSINHLSLVDYDGPEVCSSL